jgi:hypothetical protein
MVTACPCTLIYKPPNHADGDLQLPRQLILLMALSALVNNGSQHLMLLSLLLNIKQILLLQVLMLAGHNFSSSLPAAWARLQHLRALDISHNSLTGSFPLVFSSMRQLAVLRVHSNQLVRAAGTLPDPWEFMFGDGSRLQCLSVAGNSEQLVDEAATARFKRMAAERRPLVPLEINAPDSSACDPVPWKYSS